MNSFKLFLSLLLKGVLIAITFVGILSIPLYFLGDQLCEAEDALEREKQERIKEIVAQSYNGIDVSHHNGKLNWKQIATNPCIEFVYIKATEGANYVDAQYNNNVSGARRQGILVGAYHYFNSKPAQQQFKNYSSVVRKNQIDLIPVIDVEAFGLRAYQGNWKAIRQNLLSLATLMRRHYGQQPILYLNHDTYTMLGNLDDFKIWLMPMRNNNIVPKNTVIHQRDGTKAINGVPTDINWANNLDELK